MPLRGEFDTVDLAHVFQMLVLNEKTGRLDVVTEGVRRTIWFTRGGIHVPHERELLAERAVARLVRSGRIDKGVVPRARLNAEASGAGLLETLEAMGALSAEERVAALRAELEEEVLELFLLEGASFEFTDEGPPDEADEHPELLLPPNALVLEAARRLDEWRHVRAAVSGGDDVVERDAPLPEGSDRDQRVVYESADGERSIDEIVEAARLPRFTVYREVARMLDAGLLRRVPGAVLLERAERRRREGRKDVAVRLFRRAFRMGERTLEAEIGAAEALEEAGELAEAASLWVSVGRCYEEAGDPGRALDHYDRARRLVPTLVIARERWFALARAVHPDGLSDEEIDREGTDLARILKALGRTEEVGLVLSALLESAGRDRRRVLRVADLAASLGRTAVALEAYERAADLFAAHDPHAALEVARRARELDPSRESIQRRVLDLRRAIERRKARKAQALRVSAFVLVAAASFFAYGRYSKAALESYTRYSIEDFTATGRFEEGRRFYEEIAGDYPLTIPFFLSLEKLKELETAERHWRDVEAYRSRVEQEDRESRRRRAERLRQAALSARHDGDWERALEMLRAARGLEGEEDPLGLDEAIGELEDYLAAARRLAYEAEILRDAGRFEQAHAKWLALLDGYPNAPQAREARLPVLLDSEPRRARILLEGEPLRLEAGGSAIPAETPFVVDLEPGRPVDVSFVLEGYRPARVRLRPEERARVEVRLSRLADVSADLGARVLQPPALDGREAAFALERGTVVVLDAQTLAEKRRIELPGLHDVTAPPAIWSGVVAAPAGALGLLLFDRTGRPAGGMRLPGRAAGAPVRSGPFVCVRLEGGGVAFGRYGLDLSVVPLPAAATAGPAALSGGRFAVGDRSGRVWIVSEEGTKPLAIGLPLALGVASLAVEGDVVLLGDGAGGVFAVEAEGGAERFSRPSVFARPVVQVVACGGLVGAATDEEFVWLDGETGQPLARLRGTYRAVEGADQPTVVAEDGRIDVFDREGRWLESRSAGEGPLVGASASGDTVVAASPAGEVWTIFLPRRHKGEVDK